MRVVGHICMNFLIITLFLLIGIKSNAQVRHHSTYSFSINDGLSQNTIQCIIKDKRGFVWFGTEDGLNRFDGKEVTIYNSKGNRDEGILVNTVTCMIEDTANNKIYVGTNGGGISVYDVYTEKFKHYVYSESDNSPSSSFIYDLFIDTGGNVLIASSYGVSIFDPENETFDNFESTEDQDGAFPYVIATSAFADEEGVVWAGTYGLGLIRLDIKSRTYTGYTDHDVKNQRYNSNIIDEILPSPDMRYLWLATDNGFYQFDKHTGEFKLLYLENTKISDVAVDDKNGIWLSSGHAGLAYITPNGKVIRYKNDPYDIYSLEDNAIRCLYLDERKHLWIGTKSRGCIHMDVSGNQFMHYYQTKDGKGLNGSSVYALNKDDDDNIWIGTMKGISIWNSINGMIQPYYPFGTTEDISVWSIYNDSNNIVWIGTSQGLFRHNKLTGKNKVFKYIEGDSTSLSDYEVFALEKDGDGNLWVGTAFGLSKYDEDNDCFVRYQFANIDGTLSNEVVWDVFCDSKQRLWVTTQYGVNMYKPDSDSFTFLFNNEEDSLGLSTYNVLSVYEDSQNRIWLTTSNGVNRVSDDLKIVKYIGEKEGLQNAYTYHVIEYKNELWISTNKGISRINLDTERVINYDVQDGLQSNEFNPASESLGDGRMLFGGINGINVFHPDSIKQSIYSPPVYFTSYELFDKQIAESDSLSLAQTVVEKSLLTQNKLILTPDDRFLTINFAALDYQGPNEIDYFYRMLPNSQEWIPLNDKRNLTFIDLSPGTYRLEVRSTNAEGFVCDNAVKIEIIVKPPFWHEPWFISLFVLIAALMVYLIGRLDYNQINRDKEILERMVESRTKEMQLQRNIANRQRDKIARQKEEIESFAKNLEAVVEKRTMELKSAKEAAEESDRLKSAFLSNMSHEIRTPMNAIMGFSELLVDNSFSSEEKNDFAHLIRTNGDNLLNLLNDIIDISMIESGQLNVMLNPIDVNALVKEVFESFKTSKVLKERTGVSYELDCTDEPIELVTDAFRLRQILNNLISNAIKFTNEGYVKLSLKKDGDTAFFAVEDSGIGISLDHQSRIFDRFSRIDNTNENLYAGNGLGLTITKNLVEILKGSIYVESELGVGTNFYFHLPLSQKP